MSTPDPLRFTYEDARKAQLRDGIALSTQAKVAFFEEIVAFAVKFGAVRRLQDAGDAGSSCSRADPDPDADPRR